MMPIKVGDNPDVILIYGCFVFFSIHSIIEGYMFQGGWYLCLVIWLIIGFMIEHKTFQIEDYELDDEEIFETN